MLHGQFLDELEAVPDHKARTGVWTTDEHDRFLQALQLFPTGPWRCVAAFVGTRSVRQVQTHAQRYQEKMQRHARGLKKARRTWTRREHRLDAEVMEVITAARNEAESTSIAVPRLPEKSPSSSPECLERAQVQVPPLLLDESFTATKPAPFTQSSMLEELLQPLSDRYDGPYDLPSMEESIEFLYHFLCE
ncbi:hypothetical protein P43SY_007745 [Pythium insidiosum]|uniref:Myb-like DNA-binding protein n=1 Tax=Pythium insidiosum TaxID=114742 RepID=A0AAD5LZG8_PYTIN|nr:hypothetical protein P43SY_007745 [Pythium insidiosum]